MFLITKLYTHLKIPFKIETRDRRLGIILKSTSWTSCSVTDGVYRLIFEKVNLNTYLKNFGILANMFEILKISRTGLHIIISVYLFRLDNLLQWHSWGKSHLCMCAALWLKFLFTATTLTSIQYCRTRKQNEVGYTYKMTWSRASFVW